MTTKEDRAVILKLWSVPLPNENATFKATREAILATLTMLCKDIDELEERLNEIHPQLH